MTISVQAIIEYISYFFQASVIRLMPLRIYALQKRFQVTGYRLIRLWFPQRRPLTLS